MLYSVVEEPALPADEIRRIHDGIGASDPPDAGTRACTPLVLTLRDDEGQLVGGLRGSTLWGWHSIDALRVARELRGAGHGTRLLGTAEARARARACTRARLDTFDFQAVAFYERHADVVYGQLEGFPAGHAQHHMAKMPSESRSLD